MDEILTAQDVTNVPEVLSVENYLQITEDIIRKQYLTRLTELQVVDPKQEEGFLELEDDLIDNVRLYKVSEMVYQKGEPVTEKFTTVFNALSSYETSLFVLIDSDGETADFYIGVRNKGPQKEEKKSTVTLGDTLKNTLIGNFPGIRIDNVDRKNIGILSEKMRQQDNVSSVSVVADRKIDKTQGNEQFVQGLEKLVLSMQGRQYTGIIIAENQPRDIIQQIRRYCQEQYTRLSPLQKVQTSKSTTQGESKSKSFAEMSGKQKSAMIAGVATGLGGTIAGATLGAKAGKEMMAVGAMIGGSITSQLSSFLNSLAPNEQINSSVTNSETKTIENKEVTDILKMLDDEIKRTKEFDSYGMWNVAGYFISNDMATSEIAASNYRALMNGENSGREISAINSWRRIGPDDYNYDNLAIALSRFNHPQFYYGENIAASLTDATTWISGKELGIHMGLPRSSVSGFPVIKHAEFGKEVTPYSLNTDSRSPAPEDRMSLGKIFDLGKETGKTVELDNESLNMHTFITGSTGSGKSNAVYQMLNELYQDQIPFLVIEPAKGEYKDKFGHLPDVNVFSTNPKVAELINLNPFKFPESIHVLEHVDGLVEIFSVCWPMYDAMPAFFKDAILKSYEAVGWDLGSSTFEGDDPEYPDFEVLAEQLEYLINASDYASDIKSNYRGALITRVKSLTVGLNKYMFTTNQTPYEVLFDQNCILDISRVKSMETKALLMGLVVYSLNEYRMDQRKGSNRRLEHVTVLEEAHNLLKNTSGQDSDLIGKSVEMLTQTIAEIRTFGEGFIIVDQSPSSVDIAAIKNTNTKIVLRTPEANDREAIGRSMGLTEDQVNEIAKLPRGVAVVFQNNWISPVLTMINKAEGEERPYDNNEPVIIKSARRARSEIIRAIMQPWIPGDMLDFNELASALKSIDVSRANRKLLSVMICTYRDHFGNIIWDEGSIGLLREMLFDILDIQKSIFERMKDMDETDQLRSLVAAKTTDFSFDQIEEICSILTMED